MNRSPDLLNNVKMGQVQRQLRLIFETFLFNIYDGGGHFGQMTLDVRMNTPYEI